MQYGMGKSAAEPRTKPSAEAVAKRVHVFTLRVSPQLAIRVKQQAEIQGASINALLTHWVYEGLRPKATKSQVSRVGPTRRRSLGAILCDRC